VLEDADPAAIVRAIFWAAFTNCGQICAGIKRLFVPIALFGEMVDALAQLANRVRVGAASDERSQIGPVQNAMQFKRVSELVDEAVRQGAKPAAGAAPLGRAGYFYAPTIVTDVTEGMRVVDEEKFGPVLPVLRYSSVDEAIDRANATTYGLSGSVWSPDTDRAEAVGGTAALASRTARGGSRPSPSSRWSPQTLGLARQSMPNSSTPWPAKTVSRACRHSTSR
jgi:acyl-CoA reductase-like NAD-dependent aldehyde dehydrogenase